MFNNLTPSSWPRPSDQVTDISFILLSFPSFFSLSLGRHFSLSFEEQRQGHQLSVDYCSLQTYSRCLLYSLDYVLTGKRGAQRLKKVKKLDLYHTIHYLTASSSLAVVHLIADNKDGSSAIITCHYLSHHFNAQPLPLSIYLRFSTQDYGFKIWCCSRTPSSH